MIASPTSPKNNRKYNGIPTPNIQRNLETV